MEWDAQEWKKASRAIVARARQVDGWRCAHIGFEGDDAEIGGLLVWKHQWRPTRRDALLPHPEHQSETHRYFIYEIGDASPAVTFAAGELSNGVWGFYVPE